jgi:hypothetical protein
MEKEIQSKIDYSGANKEVRDLSVAGAGRRRALIWKGRWWGSKLGNILTRAAVRRGEEGKEKGKEPAKKSKRQDTVEEETNKTKSSRLSLGKWLGRSECAMWRMRQRLWQLVVAVPQVKLAVA